MSSAKYQSARKGSWKWLLVILGLGIGMLVIQGIRYQRNRPLIIAEAAVADSEGEAKFDAIGIPPGAAPRGPGEKRIVSSSSQSPTKRILWQREYEVSGSFETAHEWYRNRLLANGWKDVVHSPTSELMREYWNEKWLVTISRLADFDHPQRTRFGLQLEWHYWARPR